MLFCCLVKCGIGKTRVMEGEGRCDEVEKESREDMFLPILAEKLFQNSAETQCAFVKFGYWIYP